MVDIRVSPERLRSVANTLEAQRQEIDSAFQRSRSEVDGLRGEWTGMAQVDYAQDFDQVVPSTQQQINELFENLITDMKRIADEFERVDQEVI